MKYKLSTWVTSIIEWIIMWTYILRKRLIVAFIVSCIIQIGKIHFLEPEIARNIQPFFIFVGYYIAQVTPFTKKTQEELNEMFVLTMKIMRWKKTRDFKKDFKRSKHYIFKICALELDFENLMLPIFEKYGIKQGNIIIDTIQNLITSIDKKQEFLLYQYSVLNKSVSEVILSVDNETVQILQNKDVTEIMNKFFLYYVSFFMDKRLAYAIDRYELRFFLGESKYTGDYVIHFKDYQQTKLLRKKG